MTAACGGVADRFGRRGLVLLAGGLAAPRLARAAEPVELLVPAPSGTATDRWARGIAPFLERSWRRGKLAPRNLPGHGGLEAMRALGDAGARPVIGVLTTPLLLSRAVQSGAASPLRGIAPLAALVEEPVLLVVAPGTATEFETLRGAPVAAPIGTPPAGTGAHVTALRLAARLDRPVLVFPSSAAARQAAMARHVAATALTLPDAVGYLRDGRLAAVGIAASARSALLPEVPTLREAGLDLLGATRRGFAVSPGADPAWREALLDSIRALAEDPDFAADCAEGGQIPRFLGPEAWGGLLARQDEALRRRWQEHPWIPQRAAPS